ncbi:MAG: V-type ATP synthase subunit F [Candidatus Hermodarchaeota archaeon]
MVEEKIHIIGYEEIVTLFGLLGIEGTVVKHEDDFLKVFEDLTKKTSIAMIIINIDLSENLFEYILEFKTNNKIPFVYLLPDIFQKDIKKQDKIYDIIYELIQELT